MGHHPGEFAPIFDIDTRTNETLWEIWIDGFVQAMNLAPEGWQRVAASGDSACDAALAGIETLRACANGEKKLTRKEQDEWDRQAPDLIPIWVEVLHQWRVVNDPNRPAPIARRMKVGRNDPCPCGSGKKYKKCCGLN